MSPRPKVDQLPEPIRRELDARAAAAGFGDARGLSAWLAAEGYSIGKSAIAEHVASLKAEYDDTMREVRAMAELARLVAAQDADEQASLNDLATRIYTDQLVRAAKELRSTDMAVDERIGLLQKLGQPITQAQRAAVYARRWSAEQRRQAEAAAREAALEAAKAAGVDDETAERISAGVKIYLPDNQRDGVHA
jgi:hypothetical protein